MSYVICHISNKKGMHFSLSLLLHPLSPLNNYTSSLNKINCETIMSIFLIILGKMNS